MGKQVAVSTTSRSKKATGAGKKAFYARYKAERRYEMNKIRRLTALLKKHPNNLTLQPAIDRTRELLKRPVQPYNSLI